MRDRERTRQVLGHVSIAPPDPSWPAHFSHERARLHAVLGHLAAHLQHYGSTAVPGLCAKPIIDMMAPVASLQHADEFVEPLAKAGYRLVDAGFFKRRFFRKEPESSAPAFHLHLAVSPEWPLKNELLLRDWLIRRPDVARAYAALKEQLAASFPDDMPRYTEAKTAFLRQAANNARLALSLPPNRDWNE